MSVRTLKKRKNGSGSSTRSANSGPSSLRVPLASVDFVKEGDSVRAALLLAAVVDSSDDAIVSKNLEGIVTSWNKAAERIFGYTAQEAIGHHISLIIPSDRQEEETEILARLRQGMRIDHFETVRRRKDGALLDVSVTISPVKDAHGRVIGASKVARDITERKRTERVLTEQTRLLDLSTDAILVRDLEGRIRYWNKGASQIYGYALEEALGHTTHDLFQTIFPAPIDQINEYLRVHGRWEGELVHVRKDGSQIIVNSRWVLDPDSSGASQTILETNNDVTRERLNEQALREREEQLKTLTDSLETKVRLRTQELEKRNAEVFELSMRLLQTQDQERRHIARELHDSAGQLLTVLAMNLVTIARNVKEKMPELAETIEDANDLVHQLTNEIRTTSYLLHPPLLDEEGLESAITWYSRGLTERSGLKIDLRISERFGRLPLEMELVIFRVIQECLTNVHRHSGSKTASIQLSRETERVLIEVRDRGRGITPQKHSEIGSKGAGVGIRGMQERLRQFDGELVISSTGAGTTVCVTIPIKES